MDKAADSWKEIGSRLEALGLKLKLHAEAQRTETRGLDEGMLRRLGEAIDDMAAAVDEAVKDPAVRADVKDVLTAVPGALADTFNELAADVRRAVGPKE